MFKSIFRHIKKTLPPKVTKAGEVTKVNPFKIDQNKIPGSTSHDDYIRDLRSFPQWKLDLLRSPKMERSPISVSLQIDLSNPSRQHLTRSLQWWRKIFATFKIIISRGYQSWKGYPGDPRRNRAKCLYNIMRRYMRHNKCCKKSDYTTVINETDSKCILRWVSKEVTLAASPNLVTSGG